LHFNQINSFAGYFYNTIGAAQKKETAFFIGTRFIAGHAKAFGIALHFLRGKIRFYAQPLAVHAVDFPVNNIKRFPAFRLLADAARGDAAGFGGTIDFYYSHAGFLIKIRGIGSAERPGRRKGDSQ